MRASGFVTILNDFQDMPGTMKQLAWVQFFSWFALFAMWIYTTAAVTSHVYPRIRHDIRGLQRGSQLGGGVLRRLQRRRGRGGVRHPAAGEAHEPESGARDVPGLRRAGAPVHLVITDPRFCSADGGVGIAWSSILSMPYAILTGSLPPSRWVLHGRLPIIFIVIPQIVAAAILGFVVGRFFGGQAIYAMLVGGVSLVSPRR